MYAPDTLKYFTLTLVLPHLYDELAARLLALALVGFLLAHLHHLVARRLVLERELGEDLTEDVHLDALGQVRRVAEEEQELVKPGNNQRQQGGAG